MTTLDLDYETKSELDIKKVGLDQYSAHPSTAVLMAGYSIDDGSVNLWERGYGRMPGELREALSDPAVMKWGFNAQFERVITGRVLKIPTPIKSWRCAMALAYMQSFSGDLEAVGQQVGLGIDKQKLSDGARLIRMFCKPQKITSKQPFRWRDELTDPDDWDLFGNYCCGDVVAEQGIRHRLIRFPIQESEWDLYHLDQEINDRGLPIDQEFVRNALEMSRRRKDELTEELRELTGLANPNSPVQLTEWLVKRGYPFRDINKDTVRKVLTEDEERRKQGGAVLEDELVAALKLRQRQARTSHTKYEAIQSRIGSDGRLRFTFQFAGAGRTSRWAGRGFQPHNLMRTPKDLMNAGLLKDVTEAIRQGDSDTLSLVAAEPLDLLAGTARSAIRAPDGYELRVCDLSAIETRVTAWLSGCERLQKVFADGRDPYLDFAQTLFNKPYEEVTKNERQDAKPAVLGCTYRLGGGRLEDGKRTGLWGYAESMGVNLTQEFSNRAVTIFRESYVEVKYTWYALENAVIRCIRTGRPVQPYFEIHGRRVNVPVRFLIRTPFLLAELPSGRCLYYHLPRVQKVKMMGRPTEEHPTGKPYEKMVFSYMGKTQNGHAWVRILSHGGKIIENLVQAIARDVLKEWMLRAEQDGFCMVGHVHDEIIALLRKFDNYYTVEQLRGLILKPVGWAPDLLLDAAGFVSPFYFKG